MKRNIFAVCDLEVEYAVNFMEYLNRRKNLPFEIQAFTSVESLGNFAAAQHIELLLISARAMCREVREMDIGKVIILSEGTLPQEMDLYPSVYKYQPSSQILREVMSCYGKGEESRPLLFPVMKRNTQILGVYSPLKRCLKTSFALTLGQILAREKAVLYLNLEEYSGFEELTGTSPQNGMSDLLYYVRQREKNLVLRVNSLVCSVNNLDYIPPVHTPWDIREAPWEDWEWLLSELERNSGYEVLILDIGTEMDEIFRLLDRCSRIYMPVLSDKVSLAKLSQYENLVRVWDFPQILEKTVRITPPFHLENGGSGGYDYISRLPWTELGDYVRKLLHNHNR